MPKRRPILMNTLSAAFVAGACGLLFAALMLGSTPAYAGQGLVRTQTSFGQTVLVPPGITVAAVSPAHGLAVRNTYGVSPTLLRQVVPFASYEAPGTIIVNTGTKFLYLVLPDGRAMRYGIGVARTGFEWSGTHAITGKREWPDWTPPAEMLRRQPGLPTHMAGGPDNPLGARALYIGSTLYRIHGTSEPWTIGTNVSSGCIRLTNEDVIDLYRRVGVGTKVVVI
ncbi:MAG: L,D-transpeptidase [Cucumibacter sp.]